MKTIDQFEKEMIDEGVIPTIQFLRVVMGSGNQFHAIPTYDWNLALAFHPNSNKLLFAEVK